MAAPLIIGGAAALAGLAGSLFSGNEKQKTYNPNYSSFNSPTEQFKWTWVTDKDGKKKKVQVPVKGSQWGAPGMYKEGGNRYTEPGRVPLQKSRWQQNASRQAQTRGMRAMWDRATGKESYARSAAKDQEQKMMAAAHSQARGAAGRYNPAASRAAIHAAANAGQSIAGKRTMAEQAERIGAMNAYQQAATGIRTGDQGQFKSEADWWNKQAGWEKSKNDMARQWQALGLYDKENQRNAMMKLEAMRAGLTQSYNANLAQQNAQAKAPWMGMMQGGFGMMGSYASGGGGAKKPPS